LSDLKGGKIDLIFDRMMGVYLTRAYRIYNDLAYLREVMKPGGKFQSRRDAAMPYFEQEQVRVWKDSYKKDGRALIESLDAGATLDPELEAEAKRLKNLSTKEFNEDATSRAEHHVETENLAEGALNTFLSHLEEAALGRPTMTPDEMKENMGKGVYNISRVQVDNLRTKGDIDEGVRYLLGQFGLERTEDGSFAEYGLTSLYNTVAMMTRMAESMTFLNDLKRIGGVKDGDLENAFVYTYEEAKQAGLLEAGARPYVNVKTGKLLRPVSQEEKGEGLPGVFDPSFDMYIPQDLNTSLKKYRMATRGNAATFVSDLAETRDSKTLELLAYAAQGYLKMNSMFMFSKTIANPPAYQFRNFLTMLTSYTTFVQTSPVELAKSFVKIFGQSRVAGRGESKAKALLFGRNPRFKTDQQVLWQMLGIDQGTLDLGLLQQMAANNRRDPFGLFFDGLDEVMNLPVKDMTDEELVKLGILEKSVKGAKTVYKGTVKVIDKYVPGPVLRRLTSFTVGIDTIGKLAMFETELKVLKKARKYDEDNGVDTGFLNMTDEEMEHEAAYKTRAMSPVYSEAPLIFKQVRKWNPFLMEPFVSFFLDQFRIFHNQVRGIPKEEIASDNPIIQSRGQQRQGLALTLHTSLSAVLPAASALLLGINPTDDEEELLESAAPAWGKTHRYIYLPGYILNKIPMFGDKFDPDKPYALDLTYINAMSPVFDGGTSAVMELLRFTGIGDWEPDFEAAGSDLWDGYIKRFLSWGFTPQTMIDTAANKDGKVFDKGIDTGATRLRKQLEYFAIKSMQPGNLRRLSEYRKGLKAPADMYRKSLDETLFQIVMPAFPRPIDLEYTIFKEAQIRQEARSEFTAVVYKQLRDGNTPMTPEEIERLAALLVENRREIDDELGNLVKTATNMELGIAPESAHQMLKRAGVGQSRATGIVDKHATERYWPSVDAQNEFTGPEAEQWKRDRFESFKEALKRVGPQYRFTHSSEGHAIAPWGKDE